MEDNDQQFCLRWNNHQSTLVAVFEKLFENDTFVDCTLAAEGKCLNAHKVVLSACSPYFEMLLSKHDDNYPILILHDVKFQELKAMMDYMYSGLSDNGKGDVKPPVPVQPKGPQPVTSLPKRLRIEKRSRDDSREESQSPVPGEKKRIRRKCEDLGNHDIHSNSSESYSNHGTNSQNIPISFAAPSKLAADVPEPLETKSDILVRHKSSDEIPQVPLMKEEIETHTELMLEPKSDYVKEINEDSIANLTIDDDDMSNLQQMDDRARVSQGIMGVGFSQSFGACHLGNQSQYEVFSIAAHQVSEESYPCRLCGRIYRHHSSLYNHRKFECGKLPTFQCAYGNCDYRAKRKWHLKVHIARMHT
ncbi:hypothetical protein WA026_020679 [Henosepilachna vigintioctopunctata]|uniref:Longitudinals lacking protein n=1 Tax=Henosepilachna vigintioctopunctata TaxID=420089 RepID=A0AAW1U2N3_9CUCU